MTRRIFMLGASGTIGQATVRALVRRGHDVVVADAAPPPGGGAADAPPPRKSKADAVAAGDASGADMKSKPEAATGAGAVAIPPNRSGVAAVLPAMKSDADA